MMARAQSFKEALRQPGQVEPGHSVVVRKVGGVPGKTNNNLSAQWHAGF